MKRFKIFIAMMLVVFAVFSPPASTYVAAKEVTVAGYSDRIDLEKRIVANGETTIWSGPNFAGYLIPQGTSVFFQVNSFQVSPIDIIVYKKSSSGQFEVVQKGFMTLNKGGAFSLYVLNGPLEETAYYAFGLRSYTLSPGTFTGVLMCNYN
jgi:hypothetical protein